MRNRDAERSRQVKIVCFSDTFGTSSGNGVGRFLADVREHSVTTGKPWRCVVPAREKIARLMPVRAPSFQVPGYPDLQVSMPLEHHRKVIRREIRRLRPDCLHVSTPGPFGLFGISLAEQFRIPLVGIHHTDFPAFSNAVVSHVIRSVKQDPLQFFSPILPTVLPLIVPWLGRLQAANPRWQDDLEQLKELITRNRGLLGRQGEIDVVAGKLAESAARDMMARVYQRFTLLIARSRKQKTLLMRDFGLASDRVRYLRPGTDVERFNPSFRDEGLMESHGVPRGSFVVLHVGRLTPEKGVGFLRDIWARMSSQFGAQVHLLLVGKGNQREVEQFANAERVHHLGAKYGKELSRIYASSDLLLFPSQTETLGQVGLEAGASGLPVIASGHGGASDYILDGVTGRLIMGSEVDAWVNAIGDFVDSGVSAARSVGSASRRHIETNYTITRSINQYWDLHAEACEMHREERMRRIHGKQASASPSPSSNRLPSKPLMVISDYHAGRYFKSKRERDEKHQAFRCMLQKASDLDAEILLGGDFADHGAVESRMFSDFEGLRAIREELGFVRPLVFVRGNHDYGYTDQQLSHWIGGCDVQRSLVYTHRESGVTFTHGHILGLPKTSEAIHSQRSVDEIHSMLSEAVLDSELKPSIIAYDLAHLIESTVTRHGLNGLTTLWDGMYGNRANLAAKLLDFASRTNQADQPTWKMAAGLIGTHDSVAVAAALGRACGSWATIFGHTHDPLSRNLTVRDPRSTMDLPHLVANSGHVNRRGATCVTAEAGALTVWKYDRQRGELVAWLRSGFSGADLAMRENVLKSSGAAKLQLTA